MSDGDAVTSSRETDHNSTRPDAKPQAKSALPSKWARGQNDKDVTESGLPPTLKLGEKLVTTLACTPSSVEAKMDQILTVPSRDPEARILEFCQGKKSTDQIILLCAESLAHANAY